MRALVNAISDQSGCPVSACAVANHNISNLLRPAHGVGVLMMNLLIASYDGRAGTFSDTSPLLTARASQTSTLLSDGKLLLAGGVTNGGMTTADAELYDPANGTWAMTSSMNTDRARHTATLLMNGKVLLA